MSEKLSKNGFEWVENTPQFSEDIFKSCNEEKDERYFLKVNVQYLERYMIFIKI